MKDSCLSILIPTLPKRKKFLDNLLFCLDEMAYKDGLTNRVFILTNESVNKTIGEKRNILMNKVETDYMCFFDDDDLPSDDYLREIFKGIDKGSDCISLNGLLYIDGIIDGRFEHSIRYKEYKTNTAGKEPKYERFPNHLNAIKTSIAKQVDFLHSNFGEDTEWATELNKTGLIKTEYYTDKILFYYYFRTRK